MFDIFYRLSHLPRNKKDPRGTRRWFERGDSAPRCKGKGEERKAPGTKCGFPKEKIPARNAAVRRCRLSQGINRRDISRMKQMRKIVLLCTTAYPSMVANWLSRCDVRGRRCVIASI